MLRAVFCEPPFDCFPPNNFGCPCRPLGWWPTRVRVDVGCHCARVEFFLVENIRLRPTWWKRNVKQQLAHSIKTIQYLDLESSWFFSNLGDLSFQTLLSGVWEKKHAVLVASASQLRPNTMTMAPFQATPRAIGRKNLAKLSSPTSNFEFWRHWVIPISSM